MSIPVSAEHAARYRDREVAPASTVVDGVHAVPVPLAGSPLRSIIVYLVETSDGLVLIDSGYQHRSCWESFRASMTTLGLHIEDIRLVLLTHNHPDHVGFADQVRTLSGATVAMHQRDDFAHQREVRGGFLQQLQGALALSGAPESVIEQMYAQATGVAHHAEDLWLDLALSHETELVVGDVTVGVVPTPGHTYGHCVYTARGVVFTGDTMMAEGPTQLAIPSLASDDPGGDLLRSLERIATLEVDVAGPAHQFAYRGVTERAAELHAHHLAEIDAVAELIDRHETAWQIAPLLERERPWSELGTGTRRFALVHTLGLVQAARARA